ncbi:anthocyanin 5-aromatic acyltransferase, partial [Phalaenopsis equestris]|uniref:anthocyanin 5-aromatic acyltransferase n=1 Tax=Phalaenopsis equestris TaxID=78828 RepID=UPI0009E47524
MSLVQVTLFPNAGVTIGTALHHSAADGSSYTHFMKTWALIAKLHGETPSLAFLPPPIFDRTLISDSTGLLNTFLKDIQNLQGDDSLHNWDLSTRPNVMRATFVLRPDEIHRLSQRTTTRCSPYSLACGL